jgi:hypothetical protein
MKRYAIAGGAEGIDIIVSELKEFAQNSETIISLVDILSLGS